MSLLVMHPRTLKDSTKEPVTTTLTTPASPLKRSYDSRAQYQGVLRPATARRPLVVAQHLGVPLEVPG